MGFIHFVFSNSLFIYELMALLYREGWFKNAEIGRLLEVDYSTVS